MKKYILLLLLGSLVSCGEFLKPKSEHEYVPKTAESLNELLIGEAYPVSSSNSSLDCFHGVFDDDVTCTDLEGTFDAYGSQAVSFLALYSWQPDIFSRLEQSNLDHNVWKGHYDYILGTNAVLDYIEDVTGTQAEKAYVKAQALALRAFYYFDLVNMFGEPYNHNKEALGVPLKTTSAMELLELPRNTVDEVYRQVISDLDESERLYLTLPAERQYKADYRTSLPMVQLLKSRVYLYMENWEQAAVYAGKVINDWPQFELKDLNQITPSPQVPAFPFISNEDNKDCIWLFGSVRQFLTLLRTTVEYPTPGEGNGKRFFLRASSDLLDNFAEGDLRKELYILVDDGDIILPPEEINNKRPTAAFGKHPVSSTWAPIESSYFARAFRLSEAYLNLAEAAAFDGDPQTAIIALNTLREKRFTPAAYEDVTGLSGEALIEFIRHERRLELCFEGHRWFDLRRYGMPQFSRVWRSNGEDVKIYTLEENDPFYTWPIPDKVLEKNRNLIQNTLPAPRN